MKNFKINSEYKIIKLQGAKLNLQKSQKTVQMFLVTLSYNISANNEHILLNQGLLNRPRKEF